VERQAAVAMNRSAAPETDTIAVAPRRRGVILYVRQNAEPGGPLVVALLDCGFELLPVRFGIAGPRSSRAGIREIDSCRMARGGAGADAW